MIIYTMLKLSFHHENNSELNENEMNKKLIDMMKLSQ